MKDRMQSHLRVLCCVPHYFVERTRGKHLGQWKSVSQKPEIRRNYVEQTISSLRNLRSVPEVAKVDVRVCGIRGKSLVPLDVEFDEPEPMLLVFDTLRWMLERRQEYDYYLLVEDDIRVPEAVLANAISFDKVSMVNEVLHPNRIELENNVAYNSDLMTSGQWTTQHRFFNGKRLAVNSNPHAAIFVLSMHKFNYCADNADISLRGRLRIGQFEGGMMASAFANFLSPVSLYRPYDDLNFNYVVHQDKFEPRLRLWEKLSTIAHSVLPPPLVRLIKRLRRRISAEASS